MDTSEDEVISRMQELIRHMQAVADQRSVFLSCYVLMTRNMLQAIAISEFKDSAWVDKLLRRFADYYFTALDTYEQNPADAPRVWKIAHDTARAAHVMALQKLLLGVNAHINYDLVLSLVDVLETDWPNFSDSQRADRYADHCKVNDIIGQTIDVVQDQVLDPVMPSMAFIDRVMGQYDEMLISHLISDWRESVWQHTVMILSAEGDEERVLAMKQVEDHALRLAEILAL